MKPTRRAFAIQDIGLSAGDECAARYFVRNDPRTSRASCFVHRLLDAKRPRLPVWWQITLDDRNWAHEYCATKANCVLEEGEPVIVRRRHPFTIRASVRLAGVRRFEGEDMTSGIYGSFEGFRTASPESRAEAVRSWLVVLDTNVLLHLYSFQGKALDEFTDVFQAVGDRLFVPHQSMDEFWRNRSRVLKENQGKHNERDAIEKAFDDIEGAFRRWHQRVIDRLAPPDSAVMRELDEARETLLTVMDQRQASTELTLPDTPTYEDHVLRRLEPILEGRVGPAPSAAELGEMRNEGKRRLAERIPPGYMDSEKNPERAIGDYVVWRQTVEHVRATQLPVLFITNDQKEDWWADRGTAVMRARPELVAELEELTGQPLMMMRSRDLIELAGVLGVAVSESTLSQASLSVSDGPYWSDEIAVDYLGHLKEWREHFAIFVAAVERGGSISREDAAHLLGRGPTDSMRGAGKPFATALRRVVADNGLDFEPPLPLFAGYEVGGWMSEFLMPNDVLPVFERVLEAYGSDANDAES